MYGNLDVPVLDRFVDVVNGNCRTSKSIVNCKSEGMVICCHSPVRNGEIIKQCYPNLIPAEDGKNYGFARSVGVATKDVETSVMYIRHYITKTVSEFKV